MKRIKSKVQVTDQPMNIRFVGKREEKGEMVKAEPFSHINTATKVISLPDAEVQNKGFYHPNATEIIRLFPHFYKPIVPKG